MIKFILLHKSGGTYTAHPSMDQLMQAIGNSFKYLRDRELIVVKDDKARIVGKINTNIIELQKELNELVRSM
jgi:hypothetical protein